MATEQKLNPRKMMEKAIEVMRSSIVEPRSDGAVTPMVGAVLWHPDGSVDTAYRGELREGDHAEFTLLERKNASRLLEGGSLFVTLEPCGPNSRKQPKICCARRIVAARIKKVWIGCEDPHPKVAGKGWKYLELNGVEVIPFDRDLQEVIERENEQFFRQAREMASQQQHDIVSDTNELEKVFENTELSALSSEALDRYRDLLMRDTGKSDEEFHRRLFHQGLLEKHNDKYQPTGSGMLLFGDYPRDVMPQAGVLCTIHLPDGSEKIEDFDGPMVFAPEKVIQWVRENLSDPIDRSNAHRLEYIRILDELIREGLVNALVHRDYSIEGAKIQLVANQQFIEIRSPGKPVDSITVEQLQSFQAPVVSRNPRLHAVFNTMELAEERGFGLLSMRRSASDARLPLPHYSWEDPYLVLTIYRTEEGASAYLPEAVSNELTDSERKGWPWFSTRDKCNSREYSEAMGIDVRSARRHLNHFVSLGLARKTGSGPSTSYHRL